MDKTKASGPTGRRSRQEKQIIFDMSYSDGYFSMDGRPHQKPEMPTSLNKKQWAQLQSRIGSRSSTPSMNFSACKRQCLESGILYEDPEFLVGTRSSSKGKWPPGLHSAVVWKRPGELCPLPKFFTEVHGSVTGGSGRGGGGSGGAESGLGSGPSRIASVERGDHGDPWLAMALSALALTPRLLERVVPPDQHFQQNYCGVFRFQFWHFGEWVQVVIDDRLPTVRGQVVGMRCLDPTEFWSSLLEKAYAKLYGGYENLHLGSTTKALQDLTGGIVQSFPLHAQDWLVTYQVLNSAIPRSTLVISSILLDKDKRQLQLRNGLVTGQGYLVTGLARVRLRSSGKEVPLIRIRNPWGPGRGDWVGPWSRKSWEWDSLSDRDKQLLSQRVRNPGEFWMSYEDFASTLTHLDLVHVGPDDWMMEPALHSKRPWRAVLARRRWRIGYNAGGGPEFKQTTAMNPQFHIQIPQVGMAKCHMVVSVTQDYDTKFTSSTGGRANFVSMPFDMFNRKQNPGSGHHDKPGPKEHLQAIGFSVYEVPPNIMRLTPTFCAEQNPIDVTSHTIARETATFFTLPPGNYIVVPQTAYPNCESRFLLRIFTDEQTNIWEVNEDNMVFRPVAVTHFDDTGEFAESRVVFNKIVAKYWNEIDAQCMLKILKSHWKTFLLEKPNLELCKSLIMLRDYNISGRVLLRDMPPLLQTLQFWRAAFLKFESPKNSSWALSYHLRPLLWEAGLTVSNKVLECLVLRFALQASQAISATSFLLAVIRLHLAHERFYSIDTKTKSNPISLEEMILMTIYS